jgi:hypothetical protein
MVVVTGLGGIGKTALAVEVVRRCTQSQNLPFQAITWDSAKQELLVNGELMELQDAVISFSHLIDSLGRQLEVQDFAQMPRPERVEALRKTLNSTPCLVVVDNLEAMLNAQEILMRLNQLLGQNSRALITSRHEVAGDYFKVSLRGLSEASSILFLREEGQQRNIQPIVDADEEILREISHITEGMPLAMKLVVSQCEKSGPGPILEKLKKARGDIYPFIFLESWSRLSDAAKMLLMYLGTTSGIVSRQELEKEVTDASLDDSIQELVRLSLVNPQFLAGLKQVGYSIHQLTRYFVVNDLPKIWKEQGLT